MHGNRRSQPLLSLIFLLWTTAALPGLSVGATGFGSAQIAAGLGLGPKLQYGGGGSVVMLVPLLPWLDIDVALVMSEHADSDASGGFIYLGFLGAGLFLGGQAHIPLARWEDGSVLGAGGGLGFAGALASYNYSTLYFFYPEVEITGFLDYAPAALPSCHFRPFILLDAILRQDMDYTIWAGVGLGFVYDLGNP